jgi:hypothetical protein
MCVLKFIKEELIKYHFPVESKAIHNNLKLTEHIQKGFA